jgi:hypothetical protein
VDTWGGDCVGNHGGYSLGDLPGATPA